MSNSDVPHHADKIRVGIVGAGLGGIVLALFLKKSCPHISFEIYEAAAQLGEVGAGVALWPRVNEILDFLGIKEDVTRLAAGAGNSQQPAHIFKSDQQESVEFVRFAPTTMAFHRRDLLALLVRLLSSADKIHCSKRLEEYVEPINESEPITLHFKDGSTATCDLLVGSDGVRSAVRRTMFNNYANEASDRGELEEVSRLRSMIDPVWSGFVVYRTLFPESKLANNNPLLFSDSMSMLCGKNTNIVTYPISDGKLRNVATFVYFPDGERTAYDGPWIRSATVDEVAKYFATWDPRVRDFINCFEPPNLWAVNTVRELPTWARGRVVIMGDAAHAMTTFQASGAGQAIEDGFILATVLQHPSVTLKTLPEALKVYDEIRRPFAIDIQRRSKLNGHLYQFNALGCEKITAEQCSAGGIPSERLKEIGDKITSLVEWTVTGTAMDERKKALALLDNLKI